MAASEDTTIVVWRPSEGAAENFSDRRPARGIAVMADMAAMCVPGVGGESWRSRRTACAGGRWTPCGGLTIITPACIQETGPITVAAPIHGSTSTKIFTVTRC
jgi:hypothetical protein